MKLQIKTMPAPAVPGGRAFLLCDENGQALPQQSDVSISLGIDRLGTITVTFNIDGDNLQIAEDSAA